MVHMCQGFAFAGDVHRGEGEFDAVRIERLFDQIIFARIGTGKSPSASTPCIRWCLYAG